MYLTVEFAANVDAFLTETRSSNYRRGGAATEEMQR